GLGWSIDGLSTISRCRQTYAHDGFTQSPRMQSDDAYCLDGQRLRPVGANEYRTDIDTFARIEAILDANGAPDYFKVFSKDGRILYFGYETRAKGGLFNLAPRVWALSRVEDRAGNYLRIQYRETIYDTNPPDIVTTELLPDSISYTGNGSRAGDR